MEQIRFISTQCRQVQPGRSASSVRTRVAIGYVILIVLCILGLRHLSNNHAAIAADQATIAVGTNQPETLMIDNTRLQDGEIVRDNMLKAQASTYLALLSQKLSEDVTVTRLSLQLHQISNHRSQSAIEPVMHLRIEGVASPGQSVLNTAVSLEESQGFEEVRVERFKKHGDSDLWEYQILMRPKPEMHLSAESRISEGK